MGALYGILGIVVAIGVNSWLQSKRNAKNASWLRRLGETAVVVIVAGGSALAAAFGTQYMRSYFQDNDIPTVAQLEVEMKNQGFLLFEAFKQEIPAEYEQTMNELIAAIATGGSRVNAQERGTELLARVRRKHASELLNAPDGHLIQVLRAHLDILQLVASRESVEQCAKFTVLGPAVLGIPDRSYQRAFDDAGTKLFRAIGAANRMPEKHTPAIEDDWVQVFQNFLADGGTDADVETVMEANPSNPEMCRVTQVFLRAVLSVDGEAGRRIRAEMAYELTSAG